MASKFDINPATGKQYGINPTTGVQDDNYWATVVEPQLKAKTTSPSVSGGTYSSYTGAPPSKTDINPATGKAFAVNPQTGAWDDNYWATVVEPSLKAQSGASMGKSNVSGAFGGNTIDLPSVYKGLYDTSGISSIEAEIAEKEKQAAETKAAINDNAWLSEGTRVGRIAKVDQLSEEKLNSLRKQVATKKADIEMQLNIQTRQFDINSQNAQFELQKFNSLLSAGALDNAQPEDIASITRATGLSSEAILGAITANKAKNLQTTIQSYDDGTSQGFKVITIDQYGNIVKSETQIVGPSAKLADAGSTNILGELGSTEGKWKIVEPSGSNPVSKSGSGTVSTPLDALWNQVMGTGTSSSSSSSSKSSSAAIQKPQFAPATGIGTKYKDPSNGRTFVYTKSGWVLA